MQVHNHLETCQFIKGSTLTIGSFDGLHLGHRAIIKTVLKIAQSHGLESVVLTFNPHPQLVLGCQPIPKLLSNNEDKIHLLDRFGVDHLVIMPFTSQLANIRPEVYVEDILVAHFHPREIVVGPDHAFGKNRSGNQKLLAKMGQRFGFQVTSVPPLIVDNAPINSTRIRQLLQAGNVSGATLLLGRPYRLSGKVVRGLGRGHQLGYPTANIEPVEEDQLIPPDSVYAVYVKQGSRRWPGMMNIGIRPTFGGSAERVLEVHLLEFCGSLYGATLTIEFVARIRDERKFPSPDALQQQLDQDRLCAEIILSPSPESEQVSGFGNEPEEIK